MRTQFIFVFFTFLVVMAAGQRRRSGKCSWYGGGEIPPGSLTACGNVFNANALTSAHPNVPGFRCGTKIRVRNNENGKSVVVTVDDKGPNGVPGRILDLSRGAFSRIADLNRGVVQCSYEVL